MPIKAKPIYPVDRNTNLIGNNCSVLRDKALEPSVVSPSKSIKNLWDYRSSIIGISGAGSSRLPVGRDN